MKKLLLGCAVAGLLGAQPAQAQEGAAVFQPAGGWVADYGEDYCRLIRTFRNGSDEVSLALERTQPGDPVRIILVGDAIRTFRGADQIGYALLPSGPTAKARYVRSETPDGKQFLSFDPIMLAAMPGFGPTAAAARQDGAQNAPALASPASGAAAGGPPVIPPYDRAKELDTARGITAISLTDGLTSPVRIEMGSLRAPIAAMQSCADDLLKVWGLDPDKHKTMTVLPVLNPRSDGVLPQGTIPFDQFEKLGGGANQVRLLIGADGKPTSCTIYMPSLSQTMNSRICNLAMERASFQPAKDADGAAMASFWMGSPMFLGPPFGGRR